MTENFTKLIERGAKITSFFGDIKKLEDLFNNEIAKKKFDISRGTAEISEKELNDELRKVRVMMLEILEINEPPYWEDFKVEYREIFTKRYKKYREEGKSDANAKTLRFLKHKILQDLAAKGEPFGWLDVGCGDGRALDICKALRPNVNIDYYGIDISSKDLVKARKEAKKYNFVKGKIKKMDALRMKFNSKFDIVSAVLFLHEVDPLCLPYIIRNMVHALKSDGMLVISDFQVPFEREKETVAWSKEDIESLLKAVCDVVSVISDVISADKYPEELCFYACYVGRIELNDNKFETFMDNYHKFLEQKKSESKELRNELRRQLKERVTGILGRSDIDTKNISNEEMEKIKSEIEDEYGIKAHKIRLLNNQIEFLDDKIEEFNSGTRCAGGH